MSAHAALRWAVQRWSSARLLQLHLTDSNVRQLITALARGSAPDELASLQEVPHQAPPPVLQNAGSACMV